MISGLKMILETENDVSAWEAVFLEGNPTATVSYFKSLATGTFTLDTDKNYDPLSSHFFGLISCLAFWSLPSWFVLSQGSWGIMRHSAFFYFLKASLVTESSSLTLLTSMLVRRTKCVVLWKQVLQALRTSFPCRRSWLVRANFLCATSTLLLISPRSTLPLTFA